MIKQNKTKKVGRPTSNPKSKDLHFRLDEKTYEILVKYSEKNNISLAEAARISINKL